MVSNTSVPCDNFSLRICKKPIYSAEGKLLRFNDRNKKHMTPLNRRAKRSLLQVPTDTVPA